METQTPVVSVQPDELTPPSSILSQALQDIGHNILVTGLEQNLDMRSHWLVLWSLHTCLLKLTALEPGKIRLGCHQSSFLA